MRWAVLVTVVLTACGVAISTNAQRGSHPSAGAHRYLDALATVSVVGARGSPPVPYDRAAFGTAWSDATATVDGGNGCDTRNDILSRDLSDTRHEPAKTCPRAVVSGEFHSPYTGDFLMFSRERSASSVHIDHIVALAYAWTMGAWEWTGQRRVEFANDPANLVASDARSNQDKADAEPARWMPPNRGFHCQYAAQFATVTAAYRLSIDSASHRVLVSTLRNC